MPWVWWEEFDLSALTYLEFLSYFFDRPIVSDKETYDLFRSGIDRFYASDPSTVASHVRGMCRDWANLTKVYSDAQLDQGLWAVFGAGISCERFCFDPQVDTVPRNDAIESMYIPFRDVAAHRPVEYVMDSFYWMWWDNVLHEFWASTGQRNFDLTGLNAQQLTEKFQQIASAPYDYAALSNDQQQVLEEIFRTLLKILAIGHKGCQWCALHGLGHLHHPLAPEVVQAYLEAHRSELNAQDGEWIEACRAGRCV